MRSKATLTALAVAAFVLLPLEAGAAAEPSQGSRLTTRPQQGATPVVPDSATPDYVAYVYGQAGSSQASSLTIRRTADGSLVREVPMPYEGPTQLPGHLHGHSYVLPVIDETFHTRTGFEFHDVETGEKTGYIAAWDTVGVAVLAVGDGWVLRTDYAAVHLVRIDGSDTPLVTPADMYLGYGSTLAQDEDSVFIDAGGDLAEIDVHTGTVTRWMRGLQHAAHASITRDRLAWDGWEPVGDTQSFRIAWLDRRTGSFGSVPAPALSQEGSYLPLGDGYVASDGGSLRRLNTDSGELEEAALTGVFGALPLGDGRVVAAVNDNITGRVALLDPSGAHTLAALPQLLLRANTVLRSGNLVAATWQESAASPAPEDIRFSSLSPPGAWTYSPDGTDGTPVPAPMLAPNQMLTLAGDVTLTQADRTTFQATWPGGNRQVETAAAILGRGGKMLLVDDGDYLVGQDPHTGTELGRVPAAGPRPIGVDGTWVWRGPQFSSGFKLVGTDVVSGASHTASTNDFRCGRTTDLQVRGRWALLSCYAAYPSSAWAVQATVIDLGGEYPAWNVPLGDLAQLPALGAGFVAWYSGDPGTGQPSLRVADLTTAHETHTYGPMSYSWRVGVDDADVARLVYLDEQDQPRALDLPWVQPVGPGPVGSLALQGAAVRPATGTSTDLTFTWQGSWADAPLTYDARWKNNGDWVQPAAWQGLDANSVTVPVPADTQLCFSVRARSTTGQDGPWSASTCGVVDGSAPQIRFTSPMSVLLDNQSRIPISYIAADALSGVASYDVQYRIARSGRSYGPWITPDPWKRTKATTQVLQLGPGEAGCMAVRARDAVDHTSAWVSRCVSRPTDDRGLMVSGKASRAKSSLAYAGTYTRLSVRGASALLPNQTGRQIAVIVLRGPSQGAVDVYVGGHRLGRVSLRAQALQRTTVWLPEGASDWRGTVRLVSVSNRPARIDGIIVTR